MDNTDKQGKTDLTLSIAQSKNSHIENRTLNIFFITS